LVVYLLDEALGALTLLCIFIHTLSLEVCYYYASGGLTSLSNIVSIDVSPLGIDGDCFLDQVMARGIKIKKIGPDSFRMVCHYGIGSEDVDQVLVALRDIIKRNARA